MRGCRIFKLPTRVHTSDDDTNTVRTEWYEWSELLEFPPVVEVGSESDVEVMKVGIDWTKFLLGVRGCRLV